MTDHPPVPDPTTGTDQAAVAVEWPTAEYGMVAIPLPPVHVPPPEPAPFPPRRTVSRRTLLVAGVAGLVALALIAVPAVVGQVAGTSLPTAAMLPAGDATTPAATADPQPGAGTGSGATAEPPIGGLAGAQRARPPQPSPTGAAPGRRPEPPPGEQSPEVGQPDDEASHDRPWSMVVDNSTPGRFRASGNWASSRDTGQHYGSTFRYAEPVEASDPAWYRVDIPATRRYRVEAWFPAASGHNDRTPYIVVTTDGHHPVHISQQTNGGGWVTLGTFEIAAGDAEVVAVSRWRAAGTGYVVADAIRVTEA